MENSSFQYGTGTTYQNRVNGTIGIIQPILSNSYQAKIGKSCNCNYSSDYSKPNLNNIFSGILPSSTEQKSEPVSIKLRYNHQKTGDHDIWRLFVNGVENKVTKVIFTIPTDTTVDWEEKEQTYKSHISCMAKNVTFEKIENNIIAIVK